MTDAAHYMAAQVLVSVQWSQGDHVALATGKTRLILCRI